MKNVLSSTICAGECSRSFYYSCLLGLLASVSDGLSTYVQEPLAIGRRGLYGERFE